MVGLLNGAGSKIHQTGEDTENLRVRGFICCVAEQITQIAQLTNLRLGTWTMCDTCA